MAQHGFGWSGGAIRVAAMVATCGFVAGCVAGSGGPAPVYMMGSAEGFGAAAPPGWQGPPSASYPPASYPPAPYRSAPLAEASPPPMAPAPIGGRITVTPGESVGGLAQRYHVPARAIIAANHLSSPYQIDIGQTLQIPDRSFAQNASPGGPSPAESSQAGASPAQSFRERLAAAAPRDLVPPGGSSPGDHSPDIVPLDGPPPSHEVASRDGPTSPDRSPDVVPLDGPAPPRPREQLADAHPSDTHPADTRTGAASADAAGPPVETMHGGRFLWPVRGRILGKYGPTPGGGHNDGINIAAPRGAPVEAVASGVVAYTGNQLRGYGNLILIKHADGWISAYAHCDLILVKRGETVSRGQVIARVGSTGGVGQPQLHFELRRGDRPVNPREYMAPLPSAQTSQAAQAG